MEIKQLQVAFLLFTERPGCLVLNYKRNPLDAGSGFVALRELNSVHKKGQKSFFFFKKDLRLTYYLLYSFDKFKSFPCSSCTSVNINMCQLAYSSFNKFEGANHLQWFARSSTICTSQKREKIHEGVLLLVKVTFSWTFFTFLNCTHSTKLRKVLYLKDFTCTLIFHGTMFRKSDRQKL